MIYLQNTKHCNKAAECTSKHRVGTFTLYQGEHAPSKRVSDEHWENTCNFRIIRSTLREFLKAMLQTASSLIVVPGKKNYQQNQENTTKTNKPTKRTLIPIILVLVLIF